MKSKPTTMFQKIVFVLLLTVSNFISAQNFKGVAYMPAYRMANLADLNYDLITHVMVAFANPNEQGILSFSGDINTFVSTVHANNAKAVVSIGGGGDYSWGNKVYIYEELLKTDSSRTAFIHNIMNYIRAANLDGIDNDMEGNALALDNFNIFTQELADSIHQAGLEISAAIGIGGAWGEGLFSDLTLSKLDYIMTMSYGGVGNWNWNIKDDGHTYQKMVDDMETFTITRGMHKSKVLGGIPFYSVEFPKTAQTSYWQFHKSICEIYNDPQFANQNPFHSDTLETTEGHPVYINSIETIQKKMDYCNTSGGGIMVWETGQDCFDGSVNLLDSMALYASQQALFNANLETSQLSLYPNPTSDFFKIDSKEIMTVEIFSESGQLISTYQSSDLINISSFSAGTYIVQGKDNKNRLYTTKIIKH